LLTTVFAEVGETSQATEAQAISSFFYVLTVNKLEIPAQVKLTGKGRKTRSVPLMDKTTALLKNYLSEQHLDSLSDFEHPLFYNSQGKKLTRQGIAYILKKYADACAIEEISPHKMRNPNLNKIQTFAIQVRLYQSFAC
jgi:site-specific recombinase XerD